MQDQSIQQIVERYRRARAALGDSDRSPDHRHTSLLRALDNLRASPIPADLEAGVEAMHAVLGGSDDVIFRRFFVGGVRPGALFYLDARVSEEALTTAVLRPLTTSQIGAGWTPQQLTQAVEQFILAAGQVRLLRTLGEAVSAVLDGAITVLVGGAPAGFQIMIDSPPGRTVDEPKSEAVIRGPREGFVENLATNLSLLRMRLRTPHLQVATMTLGRSSQTRVAVVFQRDLANPRLVAEVRDRLGRIDLDTLIDTAYLEELIEDNPYSLFPQVQNTERVDTAAANIVEGRVVIMMDRSPTALIVPVTIWSFVHASEDYYERYPIAIFLRLLRVVLAMVALIGPSFWIAVVSFHQELLPTALLLTTVASREGIPFPVFVEGLLMELFFEALREAGVRLPRPVGQTISIVGALVLGEAAVRAGIVSAPMVIVVATTGIASFTIPRFNFGIALRLLRLGLMFLAGMLGLFGLLMGLIIILYHLCALRSFGVPYLQPLAPLSLSDLKDTFVRLPHWLLDRRPEFLKVLNRRRHKRHLRPRPPGGEARR